MAYWECGNILVSSMWSYLVWQAITFVLRKRSIIQPEIFWLCFMSRGKISKYVKWYLVLNCISFTTNVKISNEEIVYRCTWYQNKWNVFYCILRYTYWKNYRDLVCCCYMFIDILPFEFLIATFNLRWYKKHECNIYTLRVRKPRYFYGTVRPSTRCVGECYRLLDFTFIYTWNIIGIKFLDYVCC